jgi:hypothetical protein
MVFHSSLLRLTRKIQYTISLRPHYLCLTQYIIFPTKLAVFDSQKHINNTNPLPMRNYPIGMRMMVYVPLYLNITLFHVLLVIVPIMMACHHLKNTDTNIHTKFLQNQDQILFVDGGMFGRSRIQHIGVSFQFGIMIQSKWNFSLDIKNILTNWMHYLHRFT